MEQYEIQKLRDLPIEGVAERLGLHVGRHKCLCCFHDDHTPSMTFSVRRNTFRCYSCGAHGSTIDLTMHKLGKSFLEACQWLAREHNVILQNSCNSWSKDKISNSLENKNSFDAKRYERFFAQPWLSPEARHFLFDERHLDPRVVRWCRLNSYQDRHGTHWLQIPYFDQDGNLIGVQSRNLDFTKGLSPTGGTERGIRFRFPTGSRCSIYNLPVLKMLRPGEDLYIAEGSSDCWSLLSSGHKAIAIPSATLLKASDFEQLSTLNSQRSTALHMYPDQDAPGERLFLQLQELALRLGLTLVRHSLPCGCKDYSDFFVKKKSQLIIDN